jgi:hypothetical protein
MIERLVLGYNNYKNILVLHPIYTVIYHLLWPVSSVIERRFYTANVGGFDSVTGYQFYSTSTALHYYIPLSTVFAYLFHCAMVRSLIFQWSAYMATSNVILNRDGSLGFVEFKLPVMSKEESLDGTYHGEVTFTGKIQSADNPDARGEDNPTIKVTLAIKKPTGTNQDLKLPELGKRYRITLQEV